MKRLSLLAIALVWFSTLVYRRSDTSTDTKDFRRAFRRPVQIPFPASNPFTVEKYQLGKALFFDPLLSRSQSIACATCHNPSQSWTSRQPTLPRAVPTILNAAWGWAFFWDGRAKSLEEQALGPIKSPTEMNLPIPLLVQRLKKHFYYAKEFKRAFPDEDISDLTIGKAIATFERTVISGISPFDRWVEGDTRAISERAKRGFILFNTKAACVKCHSGWNFTNGSFADTGLPSPDRGRGAVETNIDTHFAFKTPTLRDVSRKSHFMHDASLSTLTEVLSHYNNGGTVRRTSAKLFLAPLNLSQNEQAELISFLKTLTSEKHFLAKGDL